MATVKELRAAAKAAEKAHRKINGKSRAFGDDFDHDVWREFLDTKRALLLATETPAEKEAREASEAESLARAERDKWKWEMPHDNHFPIRNQGGHRLHPFMGNKWNEPNTNVWGTELWAANEEPGKPRMRVECHQCGDRVPVHMTRTGNVAVDYPCEYPDGVTVKFHLSVPSGRLAIGNDFRNMGSWAGDPSDEWWGRCPQREIPPAYPGAKTTMADFDAMGDRNDPYYVNNMMGCVNTTLWYADNGLAHAFTGNTCPNVYRITDEHYQVANPAHEMIDDGWDSKPLPFDGEELCMIPTDLWWYSMVDADVFLAAAHTTEEACKSYVDFVDVIPGVYEFHHHYHEASFTRDGPDEEIYTDIYLVEKY